MLLGRWGSALVVLAAVTACGDAEPGAASLPPVSPVPSVAASVSASPSAAPVPSAAREATPQGAAEFARFFYGEVERAYAETDPAIIERLSAPGCEACEKFVESVTTARDNGERVEGVVYEIRLAETPDRSTGETVVSIVYDGPSAVRYAADGTEIAREPAVVAFQEELHLVRAADSWLVREVSAV